MLQKLEIGEERPVCGNNEKVTVIYNNSFLYCNGGKLNLSLMKYDWGEGGGDVQMGGIIYLPLFRKSCNASLYYYEILCFFLMDLRRLV